ncbi:MAG: CDP-alcohol phosphatidyltransferase family protein [Candidatus Latescibacteria bacterium]|jgi:CDP-diacylglycerol--glycerol-3-phosphate 3-phosphatidyltransferase|nr:CDP-alcohol phosphatidyltransferase family protein [Candidatus Latescibacterota bacterium]
MEDLAHSEATDPLKAPHDRFWTPANLLSLSRAVLTLPAVWLIYLGSAYRWELFVVVMVMVVSDVLDGHLARRRGETTEWGRILDPLADKLAIDSIAFALYWLKGLPLWVLAFVLARDAAIVLAGVLLKARGRVVIPSNVWGKLTTTVMSGLLLSYAIDLEPPKHPLLLVAGVLLIASSVSYGVGFLRMLRRD